LIYNNFFNYTSQKYFNKTHNDPEKNSERMKLAYKPGSVWPKP